ncbi:MAG: DinB family protein [Acidobacteriaceae bacterium]|jgi:uncharacterized damage-inducible protein DinB|nr:DinB family protein [Acidobacteriaceae bacterium]
MSTNSISQALLPEFDYEMAHLRKTLERVPEGKNDFRPHPKSMTLARLAGHLAEIPDWVSAVIDKDSLDVGAPDAGMAFTMNTRADMLKRFDAGVARAHEALARVTDARMMGIWALKHGEQTIFAMPRVAVMRGFVLSHMVHHRAQLGVYLRMNDVPVPSIYGPSADEN